jgi:glycosyltransferase involved in cell wall biosynthesis
MKIHSNGASKLYITSDVIGSPTGGGQVTGNELTALCSAGDNDKVDIINPPMNGNPFETDEIALKNYKESGKKYKLAHFYAGTFSKTIAALKKDGTKVTYTCAAHDVAESKRGFEELGMSFDFPHLVNPELFNKYVQGYRDADLVISPSKHSQKVLEGQGCKNIAIIPHGHNLPTVVKPLPEKFTVGYLGAIGTDKGLIFLINAWNRLGYDNQLVLAGKDSEALLPWIRNYGGGNVYLAGYMKSASDLYNRCSVYIQPSITEGFGLEVLEAMSHGRPVICSDGAGAADCVVDGLTGKIFPRRDIDALMRAIEYYKNNPDKVKEHGEAGKEKAKKYTWDIIRSRYCQLWRKYGL